MAKPLPIPEGDEYVRVRRSPKHGRGLYAARDIPKGTFIIEYTGEKVPRGEGNRRAEKQWKKGRIYVFRLNQRYDIDGKRKGNAARLVNHSCEPNAESQNERGRRIWVVATRDIAEGEEITYDYHLDFEEEPAECRCGSEHCIGYMVGPDGHEALYEWLVREGKPVPENLEKRIRAGRRRKATKKAARTAAAKQGAGGRRKAGKSAAAGKGAAGSKGAAAGKRAAAAKGASRGKSGSGTRTPTKAATKRGRAKRSA